MSFIQNDPLNIRYAPGFFLASADCTRETVTVSQGHSQVVTKADGSKYVPAGAVIPSNDAYAKGILYEDVDVTTGDMPGSLVTRGVVYEDRLPAAIESTAEAVLPGIQVIVSAPTATRPSSFGKSALTALTVSSVEGTGSGKTDVSYTGYTPAAGERTVYKIHATTAPAAVLGQVLPIGSGENDWTAATFPLDELASTDGYKITVAVVDSTNAVIASGNATIDVK